MSSDRAHAGYKRMLDIGGNTVHGAEDVCGTSENHLSTGDKTSLARQVCLTKDNSSLIFL